ncbi:cation:proton antiporter [Limosilactobacillus mucosae]|uniref:cation:proton antiporter n=1 Tax=Limosilactobacillus mucosae TaxID=97478 RepID=UPI0025A4396F|nr:sodium:proton antiporter [Limosilactobacillus mucosae]MDM8220378.1 sodium:proton antiporter [Limosilactobacillus mucosae]MDM8315188.1 sodium:proton antiporter [Limosilactobacillus mucosae]
MTTVYIVGLLLITVVAANIVHLLWPILPLAIYQILAGIMLSILPIDTHAIVLKPELFMLLIIAPLMFNDGQNVSFRQLAQNVRQILSMAVGLAIVTVILVGGGLKLALPQHFTYALAFMLAAIITPTDAVAVKSLTNNVEMPKNVNETLEYESLFNDASGLVLFSLATSTLTSGEFSIGHGVLVFLYVFFGGILFGALMGWMLIALRTTLMRTHVDIGSIVIPINVMTPFAVYWLAEEIHLSGILAVVAAGIVHSILYDQLRLTSSRVQNATITLWSIIASLLNGFVFVLLGVMLPEVVSQTLAATILKLALLGLGLYLTLGLIRYLWARFKLVDMHHSDNINRDSLLLALGGVHGTITLAMAFSIPVLTESAQLATRNQLILLAAIVILISLTVGTLAFPRLLPAKTKNYTNDEFQDQLIHTVQYAIDELSESPDHKKEQALVIDQLSSQMTLTFKINRNVYDRLASQARGVEMQTLAELRENGVVTAKEEQVYDRMIGRDALMHSQHGLFAFLRIWHYRLKWKRLSYKLHKHHPQTFNEMQKLYSNKALQDKSKAVRQQYFDRLESIFSMTMTDVNEFLDEVQTPDNVHEVAMVRRMYLNRQQTLDRFHSRGEMDTNILRTLAIKAFQDEHSYVQQQAATGAISGELANALNEHISNDQLVCIQSFED